jgi:hypothetical protein
MEGPKHAPKAPEKAKRKTSAADSEHAKAKRPTKRLRKNSISSASSEESMGSLKDFIVQDEDSEPEITEILQAAAGNEDDAAILKAEAEAFLRRPLDASGNTGTTVGGRTLRNRAELKPPKDDYYERFGRKAEEALMEKFTKEDIIEYIKSLEGAHKAEYEHKVGPWPKLNKRQSLDTIYAEYSKIKDFLGLPDSDDEASDAEESSVTGSEDEDSEVSEEESDEASESDDDAEDDSNAEDDSDGEDDSDASEESDDE